MKSKADIIRGHLSGLRVLDIGGTGYEQPNPYEAELAAAWSTCKERVCLDYSDRADITVDLNAMPLPPMEGAFDVVTAFDVLEHLEHPVDILRWIPGDRLIVILPNATSWIARHMEETKQSKHLFSFTAYTASILLSEGGWGIMSMEYQFGKWSLAAKMINAVGSLCPSRVGTGMVFHCHRKEPKKEWRLR